MEEKNKNLLKEILSYVLIILAVIAVRVFIFDPVRVDGPSMDTTLSNGEIIILNKYEYRKRDIERYDIVVVKVDGKKIIKRIIGLPNEVISIKDNKVYMGLSLIDKVSDKVAGYIIKERELNGDFKSFDDFCERIPPKNCNKAVKENMIWAGCFDKIPIVNYLNDKKEKVTLDDF